MFITAFSIVTVTALQCMFYFTFLYSNSTFTVFFFNDTATTEIYTLSLHDALPIPHRLRPQYVSVRRFQKKSKTKSFYRKTAIFPRRGIGRAHVWTPVTQWSRMPSSAWKKKMDWNFFSSHHRKFLLFASDNQHAIFTRQKRQNK